MKDMHKKLSDYYNIKPGAPLIMREFGFYSFDRWVSEGHIKTYGDIASICGFEDIPLHYLGGLGWCEAAFFPNYEEEVLETREDYELVRDYAGRHVLYFKGRRNGFMPEYVEHPVKDMRTWESDVKWRLEPNNPDRLAAALKSAERAAEFAEENYYIGQQIIGGYMYLRSLIGPEALLYMFYDAPEVVHACMESWLALSDKVTGEHQKKVDFDEVFLAEDICYNGGSLISPDMFSEFLAPYYSQLLSNIRGRAKDKSKKIHLHIDTDGFSDNVIPWYKSLGMDRMSPFEVAAGSDVVRTAAQYPELLMLGGMDKRVLAEGRGEIDRMIDTVIPAMQARGGFIPTCDHGVPEEVNFEDYVHFRKRLLEFA